VNIGVLESLDDTEGFVDVTTNWGLVDGDVSDDSLVTDDEEATVGVSFLFDQNSIVTRDLLGEIGEKWDGEVSTETTILSGGVGPSQVRELGVNRDGQDFAVDVLEGLSVVVESQDFTGADEGEVQRIEEQNNVLSCIFCFGVHQ